MLHRHVILFVAVQIFVGCKTTADNSDVKFYGFDNQRYRMKFENSFLMEPTSDDGKVYDEAFASMKYLFGAFQWHKEFINYKGIPHRKPAIKIVKKETIEDNGVSKLKVTYVFDDEVVFNKSLTKTKIDFWMPKDRKTIYKSAMVDGKAQCTDDKYWTEGDFWYFWNPEKAGCPVSFLEGLNRVPATFTAIPNTLNKFPLYGKLGTAGNQEANGQRLIYIAHGVDSNFESTDAGVKAFTGTIEELNKMGFEESEKIEDADDQKHWVYKKTANGYDIELHLGLFKSKGEPFTKYGREGLSNADVFIYNGHSGLGGYLPPSKFAPLTLPNKYQVFFFNGCSTFAYYNDTYFDKKKEATGRPGSEKLEIVTTGLEAWFGVQPHVTGSLINDLAVKKPTLKWEQIIANLYSQTSKYRYGDKNQWQLDPKKYSAHYQVNGDEDNPSDLATALKH